MHPIHVIGGGLAGSEAAWQIATRGVPVILHEMRPERTTEAHKTDRLAELVCSNSFRSDDREANAVGLLHEELRRAGSLIMRMGDSHQVPAGGALAVDREGFATAVSEAIAAHPGITIARGEVAGLPPADWDNVIIATGPLTSPALSQAIRGLTGEDHLAFFDAIAPIVHFETIDMETAWFQSRYDKPGPGGTGADYINCPMTKAEYDAFVDALLAGDKHKHHDWEKVPYFDGCLPIEVMAARGRETLRHGPMKPVGLTNRHKPSEKAYAVVQLRQDNALGTLYNMVGFQTELRYAVQTGIFRMIPGLGEAQFARLGGLHRNTFLNSPRLLDRTLRLKAMPRLRFAGQITGCEGYVESAAIGLLAGRFAAAERLGDDLSLPPPTTAFGALLGHITGGHLTSDDEPGKRSFQPMNINFGLFPPIEVPRVPGKRLPGNEKAQSKRRAISARALADLDAWLAGPRRRRRIGCAAQNPCCSRASSGRQFLQKSADAASLSLRAPKYWATVVCAPMGRPTALPRECSRAEAGRSGRWWDFSRGSKPQAPSRASKSIFPWRPSWPACGRRNPSRRFQIILIKPSHYDDDGYVIRWLRSAIPSNSLASLYGLAADCRERRVLGPDVTFDIDVIDETNTRVDVPRIIARMKRHGNFGFVGLVGVQSNQYPRALDLARPLRAAGIPVVLGGFHVSGCLSMLSDDAVDLKRATDLGVSLFAGEAEERLDQVIVDAAKGHLKPLYNFMNDLPSIEGTPTPFLPKDYVTRTLGNNTSFDAGRGCPFQCSFCTIINVQGRKSRRRSPDDVERLIRENLAQGITRYFITDDNFARNKDWELILDRIIALREKDKLDVGFLIQVDTLCHRIPNFIEKCKRAGVTRVFIGLENINPDNLMAAKKRQNKITEYRQMLLAWKAQGIITYAGYILGFPNDTAESIARDIKIIQRELPLDILEFFFLTPLPGSEDHQGLWRKGVAMDPDLNKYDLEHAVTAHPRMSQAEWEKIYMDAWSLYYTPEHMRTILKRAAAKGIKMFSVVKLLLWFSASPSVERVHPLQGGVVRLKSRRDRQARAADRAGPAVLPEIRLGDGRQERQADRDRPPPSVRAEADRVRPGQAQLHRRGAHRGAGR